MKGHMAGPNTRETGNELSQPQFEFTGIFITFPIIWSVVGEIHSYRPGQILRLRMEIPKPIMMKVVLISITIYLAQEILLCKCRCRLA